MKRRKTRPRKTRMWRRDVKDKDEVEEEEEGEKKIQRQWTKRRDRGGGWRGEGKIEERYETEKEV